MTKRQQISYDKFINKANEKYNNKFDYSNVHEKWKNQSTKVIIICPVHGEYLQSPESHLGSHYGCPKCGNAMVNKNRKWSQNDCIKAFIDKHGDKFDYSKALYKGRHEKITIICPIHGEFETTPDSHIGSITGCYKCGLYDLSNNLRSDTDEFIEKAKKIHGDKYDYSKAEYIKGDIPITIICLIHGDIEIMPNKHIHEKLGCVKCYNDNIMNKNNYIDKFNETHGDKYDYSKAEYINCNTPMTIICPIHGEFKQSPLNHKQHGCGQCGNEKIGMNQALTQDEFIEKAKKIHGDKYDYSSVKYIKGDIPVTIICPIHGEFQQLPSNHIYNKNGCKACSHIVSKAEEELSTFIPNSIKNDRSLIKPKEIDILSHEYKFGIEYNGLLWHSYGKTYPNNYNDIQPSIHLKKTKQVELKGYQLFHIFENEWLDPTKQKIWKSVISNKMNNAVRIFARKCKVVDLDNKTYKDFMINNHLQGHVTASIKLGLVYNGIIVAVMSFGKARYNQKHEWELLRFCNILDISVVGGASKLLKHFERNYNPKSIISYANRRWSIGGLYTTLGFTKLHASDVNYYYVEGEKLHTRIKFQKHKLYDLLELYDSNLSERDNMINNGYRIIYDCGNLSYEKIFKSI